MGRRIVTRGTGVLIVATLVGLVPGSPPAGAEARTVDRTVTSTPAGELTSTTLAVDATTAATARRTGSPVEVAVGTGTQMVGVSWAGDDDVEVQVAPPEGDGWGPWTDLHADDAPDVGTSTARTGVGPLWLGATGVDRVAVRVVAGAPSDLRVEAMRFTSSGSSRAVSADQPATPAGGPTIATRAAWAPGGWQGGRAGCTPAPTVMSALRFAVVHHTDGTNTYRAADVPGILAGIYRFHTATNGWCDIAYNLFVDRFGTVWEGRTGGLSAPIMGGHAKGFNTNSVGVALIGTHGSTAPSAASMTALRDVLAWKLGSHGVDPRTTTPIVSQGSPRYPAGQTVVLPTIQGHRDSGLTACPGNLLYSRLPGLRTDVAARIAATNAPATWRPSTTGAAFFGRIDDAALGRRAPNGRAGHFTSLVTRDGWPRDPLASAIVLSPETDTRVGGVDRLYRAAFGREAETGGLRYWVGRRDDGMTLTSMARQFSGTPEFRQAYDALDDTAFVTAIYRNILGRDPEASGRDYWVGRLAGGMPRHQLLASFSESAEHRARARIPGTITRAYFVLLDRAASAGERSTWTAHLSGGGADADVVA
ncbi:MAG TPA: DUF4214 domain-containing protein, partial [Iamia sp.]